MTTTKREIYRILDVAANRGREALRVVEDAARFLGDDAELTARLKETRHAFAAASERLDRRERLRARDTVGDVGTVLETPDEYRRSSLAEVLAANFARFQESARSLEEYSKIVAPETTRDWERVRYASYSLEKLAFAELTRLGVDPFEELADDADEGKDDDESGAAPRTDSRPDSRPRPIDETPENAVPNEVAESDFAPRPAASRPASESTSEPESERVDDSTDAETDAETVPATQYPFFFGARDSRAPRTVREARRARLATAAFCAFVDSTLTPQDALQLLSSEIDAFQLVVDPDSERAPREQTAAFFDVWNRFYSGSFDEYESRPLLLARNRVDWVARAGFDGAALDRGLDWRAAREILGPDALLGATVSTLDEALAGFAAADAGILDFLEAGPVFASRTLATPPTGTAFLRALVEATNGEPPIPIFAVGGIDSENCAEVFDSGIERLGVGAAILNAADKRAAAARLRCLF